MCLVPLSSSLLRGWAAAVARLDGVPLAVLLMGCAVPVTAKAGAADSTSAPSISSTMRRTPINLQPSPQAPPIPSAPRSRASSDAWGPLFKAQVERCWKKPPGQAEAMEAVFSIKLKRDGTLEEIRTVTPPATTPAGKSYQLSAYRAILNCQPYDLPDTSYDQWRYFEPVFTQRIPPSTR